MSSAKLKVTAFISSGSSTISTRLGTPGYRLNRLIRSKKHEEIKKCMESMGNALSLASYLFLNCSLDGFDFCYSYCDDHTLSHEKC